MKIKVGIIVLVIMLVSVNVFGGVQDSLIVDPDTFVLTINGSTKPETNVTLKIYNSDLSLDYTTINTSQFYAIKQVKSDVSGNYSFVVKFSTGTIPYSAEITEYNGKIIKNIDFTQVLATSLIDELGNATTIQQIKTITRTFVDMFMEFGELVSYKDAFLANDNSYSVIWDIYKAGRINSLDEYKEAVMFATGLLALGQQSTVEDKAMILDMYKNYVIMPSSVAYPIYNNEQYVDSNIKTVFTNKLAEKIDNNVLINHSKFEELAYDCLALTICSEHSGYSIGDFIIGTYLNGKYSDDSTFASAYNSYCNSLDDNGKTTVAQKITGKVYDNSDLLKVAFINEVNNLPATNKPVVNNRPSAPSGGGGGGGGSYVPKVNQQITVDADVKESSTTTKKYNIPSEYLDVKFDDLNKAQWAGKYIISLACRGVVSGKDGTHFAPNDNITREEFAKIIVNSLGLKDEGGSISFSDVPPVSWYYPYINIAHQKGIVTGDGNAFGTGRNITRQDMATMVYRALKAIDINIDLGENVEPFKDHLTISDYAFLPVYSIKTIGAISGMPDNTFAPNNYATRAEASKIIVAVIEYIMGCE